MQVEFDLQYSDSQHAIDKINQIFMLPVIKNINDMLAAEWQFFFSFLG